MAIVKALRRLASGGFGLIAASDQIACDAGAMTVTPTGGTQQSVPDAIGARVLADANGRVAPSKLGMATSNLLFNGNFTQGTSGITVGGNVPSASVSIIANGGRNGSNALYLSAPTQTVAASNIVALLGRVNADGVSSYYPVLPEQIIEVSAGIAGNNGTPSIRVAFFDGNDASVGSAITLTSMQDYRVFGFVTVPPGAVAMQMRPRFDFPAGVVPYGAFFQAMLAVALPGQTEPSPYVDPNASAVAGSGLIAGSVPPRAFFAPTRGQFFRALENSGAGRVATVTAAVPSDQGDATNIAFNHTTFVTQSGVLAQFVKTSLGLTDAQLAAIITAARSVAE